MSSSIIIIKYLSSIVTSGWHFREIKKDTVPAWKALSSKLDRENMEIDKREGPRWKGLRHHK